MLLKQLLLCPYFYSNIKFDNINSRDEIIMIIIILTIFKLFEKIGVTIPITIINTARLFIDSEIAFLWFKFKLIFFTS